MNHPEISVHSSSISRSYRLVTGRTLKQARDASLAVAARVVADQLATVTLFFVALSLRFLPRVIEPRAQVPSVALLATLLAGMLGFTVRVAKRYGIPHAVLAIPTAPGQTIRKRTEEFQGLRIKVKTVPGTFDPLGVRDWKSHLRRLWARPSHRNRLRLASAEPAQAAWPPSGSCLLLARPQTQLS